VGILSSLFAGVSGLAASGNTLSVVGDNIANSQTTGFKAARTEFVDVLSQNLGGTLVGQIGAGSRLAGVAADFGQGSLEATGVTTDIGIDGNGFFIVQDPEGVFYTRAGVFRLDANETMVNSAGQTVLGFGITANGIPNGALGAINLSTASSQPQATSTVDINVNLDPNDQVLPGGAAGFNHSDPVNSSNFQTGIRVFDSLGNPRDLTVYFRKSSTANEWYYYAGINRDQINFGSYGAPFTALGNTPGDQFVPLQTGTLQFTTGGLLQNEVTTALSIPYDLDGNGALSAGEIAAPAATPANAGGFSFLGGPAAGQLVTFDFGDSITQGGSGAEQTTQFGGVAATGVNNFIRFTSQDGFSAGSLQGISINPDGFVEGLFSNGQTVLLAQVALARFANENGLSRVGDSNFSETVASGTAIIGSPNQGSFGAARSGFLELSNTDLAEEFVRLILAQRSFQANTRTISATNELLQQLVVLGQ
jgi:flagellar hook protein FlgE